MQHDHACWVAVLNADFEPNACGLRGATQRADQGDSLSSMPFERPIRWHGMNDQELGVMQAAERQCVVECGPRGL
jgi:hypothetical protein